ncbi:hypothetical protein E4U59_002294 [Claviceps monticola]|nr:hypothetical protein E4U59_002294 [Claviceps monticola]
MTSRPGLIPVASLLCPEPTANDEAEKRRNHPWLIDEDYLLICMVKGGGARQWTKISAVVGSRSPKQCRERWHQNLKPNLNHDPITSEEGEQILHWVDQKGQRWADISRLLTDRCDNKVKNWFYGQRNRIMREENAESLDLQQEDDHQVSSPVTNFALPLPSVGSLSLPHRSGHAHFQTDGQSSRFLSPCASDHDKTDGKNVDYTTSLAAERPRPLDIVRYFPEPPRQGPCVWHRGGTKG